MKILNFAVNKIPPKIKKEVVSAPTMSLEEFNDGCERVAIAELRLNGCRAIVEGEKENALYCNAQRIIGSRYWFCEGHAKYFFNR